MDHVGSSYFRHDLGRLTVCKQWFIFARIACFKNLQYSQKTLRRLLSSQDVERSLLAIKGSLEILDLELEGFEDWSSIPEPQSYPQDANTWDASIWGGDLGRVLLADWTTVLDNDLAQLAANAILCSLIFRDAIISHYPRICPDVLRPQHHDTNLRSSEVLINLSLSTKSSMTTSAAHSTRCGSTGGGFLQLKADIEDQAKALAARMASPKTIRILTHSFPHTEMQSLDVLTGKNMTLADDMEWEDDGKTVEDVSDLESEISDDSFSTSSDA
ncbi:hypothetical protein ABKA04_004188 [Annulohypoxylon sp. FPYF3050]